MKTKTAERLARIVAGGAVLAMSAFGAGTALGVGSSVLSSGPAGADTPSFNATCNITGIGTVLFPLVITGSIPATIPNGSDFSVSDSVWEMTIPAQITTDINIEFGANATFSSSLDSTIVASGTEEGSEGEAINFGTMTVPASGTFLMDGTPTTTTFTGTGASVAVTAGPTVSAFSIIVNGSPLATGFSCTMPSPAPVIAYAAASNGPFAFVARSGGAAVTPFSTADNATGTPIGVGTGPDAVAASPDGSTVYVADETTGQVTPISTATDTAGSPLSVGGTGTDPMAIAAAPDGTDVWVADGNGKLERIVFASGITYVDEISVGGSLNAVAVSPDGSTVWVADLGADTVTPVSTATNSAGTPITVSEGPQGLAVSPDGSTVWVSDDDGSVTPISTATDSVEGSIGTFDGPTNPQSIAVSPDGSTVYVDNTFGYLDAISTASQTETSATYLGSDGVGDTDGLAVSPDGSTVYAVNGDGFVIPVSTSTDAVGTPISVGSGSEGIAITPDQGPTASLRSSTSGDTTSFDASASVPGTSPIASYSWNFGDPASGGANTEVTGPGVPDASHAYTAGACAGTISSPACVASVTVTDVAGTSTTQTFTGQSASQNGSSAAEAQTTVVIAVSDCETENSCQAAISTPATSTTPAQAIAVTIPAAGSSTGALTVTSTEGQLLCKVKGFTESSSVTSFSADFTPSTNVDVTDVISGVPSTKGIKICFEGESGTPAYLSTCKKTGSVAPCVTLTEVSGNVAVTILVPGSDPKFHINGIQSLTESPTSIGATGKVGKTITIKGTNLLGPNQKVVPNVSFTSLGGSTLAVPANDVVATATSIVVDVISGAGTGPMVLTWNNGSSTVPVPEIAVTAGSITIVQPKPPKSARTTG